MLCLCFSVVLLGRESGVFCAICAYILWELTGIIGICLLVICFGRFVDFRRDFCAVWGSGNPDKGWIRSVVFYLRAETCSLRAINKFLSFSFFVVV